MIQGVTDIFGAVLTERSGRNLSALVQLGFHGEGGSFLWLNGAGGQEF